MTDGARRRRRASRAVRDTSGSPPCGSAPRWPAAGSGSRALAASGPASSSSSRRTSPPRERFLGGGQVRYCGAARCAPALLPAIMRVVGSLNSAKITPGVFWKAPAHARQKPVIAVPGRPVGAGVPERSSSCAAKRSLMVSSGLGTTGKGNSRSAAPMRRCCRGYLPHPKSLSDSERDFNIIVLAPLSASGEGLGVRFFPSSSCTRLRLQNSEF